MDVLSNTDDLAPHGTGIGSRWPDALAQRRCGRPPHFASEVLGDDYDPRASVDVVPRDVASCDQTRTDRAEVPGRHELDSAGRWGRAVRILAALDPDAAPRHPVRLHRHRTGETRGTHTRERRDLVQNLVLHPRETLRIRYLLRW